MMLLRILWTLAILMTSHQIMGQMCFSFQGPPQSLFRINGQCQVVQCKTPGKDDYSCKPHQQFCLDTFHGDVACGETPSKVKVCKCLADPAFIASLLAANEAKAKARPRTYDKCECKRNDGYLQPSLMEKCCPTAHAATELNCHPQNGVEAFKQCCEAPSNSEGFNENTTFKANCWKV